MIHVYWVQKLSCSPTLITLLTCYILDETTQSEVLNSDNSNCKLNNKLMHRKQGNSHSELFQLSHHMVSLNIIRDGFRAKFWR